MVMVYRKSLTLHFDTIKRHGKAAKYQGPLSEEEERVEGARRDHLTDDAVAANVDADVLVCGQPAQEAITLM